MRPPHFEISFVGDEKSIELIEMLLACTLNPYSRLQFEPGHLTATGLVLHPDGQAIAMVLHGRLNRWLLPGGHVEDGDLDILAAAGREVLEETGLSVHSASIIGADVHGIPLKLKNGVQVEPYHLHHDVLVGCRTDQIHLLISDESKDLKWIGPRDFDAYAVPPNVRRGYARMLALVSQ